MDASDADGRDRSFERDVADRERGARGNTRDDVGVVFGVVAEHHALDEDLVHKAVREERTDRTVDHAHREDFLLTRRAFALLESARELAGGGGLLAVVDREGEEVDAFARIGADNRREHGCACVGREHGAAGEFADDAGFEREDASADFLADDNSARQIGETCGSVSSLRHDLNSFFCGSATPAPENMRLHAGV